MANYYFLASLFPELTIGSPPELSFFELKRLFVGDLTAADRHKMTVLRRLYDVYNIRALWKDHHLSEYGNFDEKALEEAILTRSGLPEYVYDFLDRYDDLVDRLQHFPLLLGTYFREEIPKTTGFLHDYLIFERESRLVMAAFRAKKLGRDLGTELQYEDPYDPLVAQILAQKDSPSFEGPVRYEGLVSILESKLQAPMEVHRAVCEYRFQYLSSLVQDDFFSIDRILSYVARLNIVEEWLQLDRQTGLEIVETIVKEAS